LQFKILPLNQEMKIRIN